MIFPVEIENVFIKESLTFFVGFGIVCYSIMIPTFVTMKLHGMTNMDVFVRALNVVTWIIPPSIPIFFGLN